MNRILILLLSTVLLLNCSSSKQSLVENNQTIKTYTGEYLEFIGLEHQSAEEFYYKLAPKDTLLNVKMPLVNFCSGIIENELKYPVVRGFKSGKLTTIVVVEPQNESYLKTYALPETKRDTIARWNDPIPLQESDHYEMVGFTSQFLYSRGRKVFTPLLFRAILPLFIEKEERVFGRKLRRHVKKLNQPEDFELALDVLKNDGNTVNRTWASIVVRNFKPTPEVLELLMIEPMREMYGYGNTIASTSLFNMRRLPKYWDSDLLAPHVQPALYGSNPNQLSHLFFLMKYVSFEAGDELKLLPENDFFVRQLLISQYRYFSGASRKALSNMAGKKLKTTEEALAWLDEVQAKRAVAAK